MSVKNWDKTLRPREKAMEHGFFCLSDAELLAIILRTGTKEYSSVELADNILKQCGGLKGVFSLSMKQIMEFNGVGLAKATELMASIELVKRISYQNALNTDAIKEPLALINWLQQSIGRQDQEYFILIFLDVKNRVIGYRELYKGTTDAVDLCIRDVYREALNNGANKIIAAHNHPSQSVTPSIADSTSTRLLLEAGKLMNIPLVDHIIISYKDYYSYREKGLL